MPELKYFKKIPTNTHVWYYLFDEKNVLTKSVEDDICFRKIYLCQSGPCVPEGTSKIVVKHLLKNIPYDEKIIKKYVSDLNKFGFLVNLEFSGDDDNKSADFTLELKDFEYKVSFYSALCLIRALFETGAATIPAYYFETIEAADFKTGGGKENLINKKDFLNRKFHALQQAHIKTGKNYDFGYPNTGHMITFNGNFTNPVDLKKVWENIKKSKLTPFDSQVIDSNKAWSDAWEEPYGN